MADTENLIHAFLSSRLDNCNVLLSGLPPAITKRLETVKTMSNQFNVKQSIGKFTYKTKPTQNKYTNIQLNKLPWDNNTPLPFSNITCPLGTKQDFVTPLYCTCYTLSTYLLVPFPFTGLPA